jgi:hypothetical protein
MKELKLFYEYGASRSGLDDGHDSNVSAITLSPSMGSANEKLCRDLLVEVGLAKRKQAAMRGRSLAMEALKFMTTRNAKDRNGSVQRNGSDVMPAMPIRKASMNLVEPVASVSNDTSEERFQACSLDNRSEHGTPVIPPRQSSYRLKEEMMTAKSNVPFSNASSTNFKPSQLSIVSYASTIHTPSLLSNISPLSNLYLERWNPEVGIEHFRTSQSCDRWNDNDLNQTSVTPAKQKNSSMKVIRECFKEKDDHVVHCEQEDGFGSPFMMDCWDGQRTSVFVRIRQQDIGIVSSPSSLLFPMETCSRRSSYSSCKSNPSAPPRLPRRKSSHL